LLSDTDYNLNDYDRAEPVMLEHLADSQRPVRTLDETPRCSRSAGFLATVAELMDAALQGQATPISLCYIHDAQENMLSLDKVSPVESLDVLLHGPNNVVLLNTSHKHLLQLDFTSTHKRTGKKVNFSVYEGTRGALRGVPVQICYQPNWWFQVVLNLRPEKTPGDRTLAAR
jgi:hypothetical protein